MPKYLFRAAPAHPRPAHTTATAMIAADTTTTTTSTTTTTTTSAAPAAVAAAAAAAASVATFAAADAAEKLTARTSATAAATMDSGASNQIRQMANFILQEAHEKANEINIKTEHDFNLEKQMIVHTAKLKIQEEYAQKEKDREIQDRISRSTMIGNSRVKKMTARDDLLQELLAQATREITTVSKGKQYPTLLKALIVQSMIKIEEDKITVICREQDIKAVKSVVSAAASEYVKLMKTEAGVDKVPVITVEEVPAKCLAASCPGGVAVSAANGRIVCDNTLSSRLTVIYQELLPKIRGLLFPAV